MNENMKGYSFDLSHSLKKRMKIQKEIEAQTTSIKKNKFEEQFPSLTKYIFNDLYTYTSWAIKEDIQKHCIDKSLLKEIIIDSMKEAGGQYEDIESAQPEQFMAAHLLNKIFGEDRLEDD